MSIVNASRVKKVQCIECPVLKKSESKGPFAKTSNPNRANKFEVQIKWYLSLKTA